MSGTLNDQLNQIADTKSAIADAINSKGIQVSENDPFATYATKIKQIQGGEGGNAFNLFDIKVSDHKLEGTEALGWAEQGTNVYKTDYPDFYNKCLEEYNNGAATRQYIKSNITLVGATTDTNGVLDNFGVTNYATVPYKFTSTSSPWEVVIGLNTSSTVTGREYSQVFYTGGYWSSNRTIYCYISAVSGHLTFSVGSGGSLWEVTLSGTYEVLPNTSYVVKIAFNGSAYSLYYSLDDGKTFILDATKESSVIIGSYTPHFGMYVNSDNDYAYQGSIDLMKSYISVDGTVVWNGADTLTVYKNDNLHSYYDIADSADIDLIFTRTNNADFYGIDQELEYVKLPRNSHFDQDEAIRKTYYCVGNTEVGETTIDITKEIELNNPFFLGQSQYFENEPNNLSWLKSDGSYHTKEMYPSMYQYILENVQAGTKDFVDVNGEVNDYCYVIDEQNETFRLPLLNGSESIPGTSFINLTTPSKGEVVAAPSNGRYIWRANIGTAGSYIYLLNNSTGDYSLGTSSVANHIVGGALDVRRNDTVTINTTITGASSYFRFIPFVGNGSLYYFVGEAVNNANIINAGKIQTQLVNKLDTRLGNLPQESKSYLAGMGMPSNKYIDLTLGATGTTYFAPANGFYFLQGTGTSSSNHINLERKGNIYGTKVPLVNGGEGKILFPVKKGDEVYLGYVNIKNVKFRFIYAEGEQ